MGPARILSVTEAREAALEENQYALWVRELEAARFNEPGWVKLEPPLHGGVLFLHRERERCAIRVRGVQ
jgi:hypothetical protein